MAGNDVEVKMPSKGSLAAWAAIIVLVVAGAALLTTLRSVGASEVAVIVDPLAGEIVDTVEGPRFFFKAPLQEYLRLTLAKDIAASGGKGNATAQVIPVPLPAGG